MLVVATLPVSPEKFEMPVTYETTLKSYSVAAVREKEIEYVALVPEPDSAVVTG